MTYRFERREQKHHNRTKMVVDGKSIFTIQRIKLEKAKKYEKHTNTH